MCKTGFDNQLYIEKQSAEIRKRINALGGKLYLVYTRKAGNNDHVFRHRAPLFVAEVDTDTMTVKRHTEQIVIPERGARLGNFGVTNVSDSLAYVTVNEWMQPAGCEKYGSNNALWVARITL